MFKWIKSHLHNNNGDANISKITIIAIAFVVGAILLVLITSAFRNPINQWFEKVSNDWFASENGEFNLMNNPFANYERNANGTYKDVEYRLYYDDGHYQVIYGYENLQNGSVEDFVLYSQSFDANGQYIQWSYSDWFATDIRFSDDGKTIYLQGETFHAYIP